MKVAYCVLPLPLKDRQEVTVAIYDERYIHRDHPLLASSDEWASAAADDISLDEVRRAPSGKSFDQPPTRKKNARGGGGLHSRLAERRQPR